MERRTIGFLCVSTNRNSNKVKKALTAGENYPPASDPRHIGYSRYARLESPLYARRAPPRSCGPYPSGRSSKRKRRFRVINSCVRGTREKPPFDDSRCRCQKVMPLTGLSERPGKAALLSESRAAAQFRAFSSRWEPHQTNGFQHVFHGLTELPADVWTLAQLQGWSESGPQLCMAARRDDNRAGRCCSR
jgi:hypothetical protein